MRNILVGPYSKIEKPEYLTEQETLDFLLMFDWDKPWKKDYLARQINRYTITIDFLSRLPEETEALEVGAMPFGFTLLLRHFLFSNVQASSLEDNSHGGGYKNSTTKEEFHSRDGSLSYEIDVQHFNMEKDPWPYDAETLDLVIASEVMEHLIQDPMHVVSEANRVLRTGGKLFFTTPNLLSLWKLNRMFNGLQPIGDPFYRLDSIYNRHNREFTPDEVRVLYESGGFDIEYIHTLNVKKKNIANLLRFLFIRLLAGSIRERKDIIFAMGTKTGKIRERYPTACQLYK